VGNKYRTTPPPFNFYELVDLVKDELNEQQVFLIKDIIDKSCEDKEALMPLD